LPDIAEEIEELSLRIDRMPGGIGSPCITLPIWSWRRVTDTH
jgi:hypothetical protein